MSEEIERLNYYQLQFLGAEDFKAEQVYHRDMRRRHLLGHHTWGIITGLKLIQEVRVDNPDAFDIFVEPGLAVDGFGREIVVGARYKLDGSDLQFLKPSSSTTNPPPLRNVTVHIAYSEEQANPPAFGYGACDEDGKNDRVRELFRIVMNAKPPFHAPVRVDGRDLADDKLPLDDSVPYQELPDTATTRWLVPLGTVGWNATGKVFGNSAATLPNDRVYAGVIAEDLIAPAGELHIRRRETPKNIDLDDFAVVEGRLEVQGELHADRKVVVDGDLEEKSDIILHGKLSFATPGTPDDDKVTIQRLKDDLHLAIGKQGPNRFVIGQPASAVDNVALAIGADHQIEIPDGCLRFGSKPRQMLVLATTTAGIYAIGVGGSSMFFRTAGEFSWHDGGSTVVIDGQLPVGKPRMRLDPKGALHLQTPLGQLLNLSSPSTSTSSTPGLGVQKDSQTDTLYFRSVGDFSWFRGGNHSDTPNDPNGGTLVMNIAKDSSVTMPGPLTVGGLTANGPLTVNGPLTAGSLTVSGNSFLQSLDVVGPASVGGKLFLNDDIVMPAGKAIEIGGARFPIDVMAGVITKSFANGTTHELIPLTPKIKASAAFMLVALASIRNDQYAFNAQWSVKVNGPPTILNNQFTFDLEVTVVDDGFIEAVSYVAFFLP